MAAHISRPGSIIALSCFAALVAVGCGAGSVTPSTATLNLPDGTSVEVSQGAGAASLANSAWQCIRTTAAGQSLAFVTLRFGADGALENFEDSMVAQEIFGTTITFDGARHATAQKGITYSASTYGAETSDGTGFSFEGRLTAYAGGIQVGYATAIATATLLPDDPNTMAGTFSYSTRVTVPVEIPGAETDEEFAFIANRMIE